MVRQDNREPAHSGWPVLRQGQGNAAMKAFGVCSLRMALPMALATGALAALSGCGPAKVAYVPPPPPPPIVVIPPRPLPPHGVSATLVPPPVEANGLYRSVNRNISPTQSVWNLRSAYNVAALNCREPRHAAMIDGYRAFLRLHAKSLKKANKQIDSEFTALHGRGYVPYRETYMTEVYNHYALPPTMSAFCDAVSAIALEAQSIKPAELEAFAARSLPGIEVVFDNYYRRVDQYRAEVAAWEASYGVKPALAVPDPALAAAQRAASGAPAVPVLATGTAAPASSASVPTSQRPPAPGAITVTLPPAPRPSPAAAAASPPALATPR
jgi:hypothetical protein